MNLKDKKILIISPHLDDEAICSGGLIMLAKKQGAGIFVLYMANGKVRQFIASDGQAPVNERAYEAHKASIMGNFKYKIAFEGDEIMKLDALPQQKLIEVIEDTTKEWQPDIVVIPNRNSFNQDHRAVGTAAMTALRPLPDTLRPQPKMILEMEEPYTWPEIKHSPNFYFDITDVIDEKMELYSCHASQVPKDPFPRSINNLKRLAGMRGCDISVQYAEGYNLIKGQLI